jgi:ATP-dependent Clp protease ATP-binding subunit ClpC
VDGINEPDDLYLAYARTNSAKARLTGLSYSSLRHIVTSSLARRCIVVLDCCYAGKAIGWMSNEDAAPSGEVDIQGTYILTATAGNQKALAPDGDRNSAFTGALLRLIRDGIDNRREFIRIDEIHPFLAGDLKSRNLPVPRQRPVDSIGGLAFARNPRWKSKP